MQRSEEYHSDMLNRTYNNLVKRGFAVTVCAKASDVKDAVSAMFAGAAPRTIGFGNSQAVRQCGVIEWAESVTDKIYRHDPRNFSPEDERKARLSDVYFTSVNAISEEGHIINIDGTGDRTSATCFGSEKIIYIVGINKISPDLETAMERAEMSAIRLATLYRRNTPCAKTGQCRDCIFPECVCGVTTVCRKAPAGSSITVILVNEDLGL